ncbi:Response to drug-related protein [Mycena chlorophos]|uniref:Response to drug-related protein n=1 Tax=Mycena chlorophos TaxID=658473 RepID=A0A8H6WIX2_MYCCL|nr:Response to drug-related protein [Mycena chlorophos]
MGGLQLVKTLNMGKGVELRLLCDDLQPEDSPLRWATDGAADGKASSDVFNVPLHWHRYHSENMTVLEGRVEVTLGGLKRVMHAGDEFIIPPRVVHGFRGFKGEKMVMRERATPGGDYKVLFFNDLLEEVPFGLGFWHAMRSFYEGDGYPSLGLYFQFFDVAFVTVFGGIAKLFMPKKVSKIE